MYIECERSECVVYGYERDHVQNSEVDSKLRIAGEPSCRSEAGGTQQTERQRFKKWMRVANVPALDFETQRGTGHQQAGETEPDSKWQSVGASENCRVGGGLGDHSQRSPLSAEQVVRQVKSAQRVEYHTRQTQNRYQIMSPHTGHHWPDLV